MGLESCAVKYVSRYVPETPDVRFWRNVKKTETCWEWMASRTPKGYGQFGMKTPEGKKIALAHRASFFFANGREAANLVCHKCDNPPCVRPDHLYDGTVMDNARDKKERGRMKPHCRRGHLLDEANLRIHVDQNGVRRRKCRRCAVIRSMNAYRRGGEEFKRRKNARRRKGPRPPKTHCPQGHEYSGGNFFLTTRGYKRCRICHRASGLLAGRKRYAKLIADRIQAETYRGYGSSLGMRRKNCRRGHLFTPENTIRDRKGKQRCRICRRASRQSFDGHKPAQVEIAEVEESF